MKLKSERMDPLIERAKDREDHAAKKFSAQNSELSQQERRLQDLAQFREEYSGQLESGSIINPALLRNRIAFIERVEQAVSQQKEVLEKTRDRLEIERTRLMLASRDKQVLKKLADSYRGEEARVNEKRQQNILDELSSRNPPKALGSDPEDTP